MPSQPQTRRPADWRNESHPMAPSSTVAFLVFMMLLTGVCNTLLTKFQDNQCVRNCDPKHSSGPPVRFQQPVLQTAQMFVGEMGCWLIIGVAALHRRLFGASSPTSRGYHSVSNHDGLDSAATHDNSEVDNNEDNGGTSPELRPSMESRSVLRGYRVILLALPAICDICGTTLMNAGLLLVAASIYQMTRGALVLFVGLFSTIFLRRRLRLFQWLSLVGVVLGVAVVGLAGAIWPDKDDKLSPQQDDALYQVQTVNLSHAAKAIIGVLLIAAAQIFTAGQFVLEEWMLENSPIAPIEAVGWEGIFGFAITLSFMLIMHFTVGRTADGRLGYFDLEDGLRQLRQRSIWISSILIMISIGGFNFFGLSVTRSVSATSRSTIDTCRTLFIWIFSLAFGWESFKLLQVVGFALLGYSTFVFNGIVRPPCRGPRAEEEEVERLLPEEPIEHQ